MLGGTAETDYQVRVVLPSLDLRWNDCDRDADHIELFLGQFPQLMQLSRPRLQLVDVFARNDHRGGSVTLSPCSEAPDDGISDIWFFVVEPSHQNLWITSERGVL